MRKQDKNRLYRIIAVLAAAFLALFAVIAYLLNGVNKSGFFKIKNITARVYDPLARLNYLLPADKIDLSYLKGRDIITIDLRKEQEYLSRVYSGYKNIRLIRILPDKIFADFLLRKPAAYLKLYRRFCIDDDLVLFDFPEQQGKSLELPVISGLETKIFGPKTGTRYNLKELAAAVEIITFSSNDKYLKNLRIISINPRDLSGVSFILQAVDNLEDRRQKPIADSFEVKIGQENINDKINLLSGLLAQGKNDLVNIKYIDLRFKEPVIKLKDN